MKNKSWKLLPQKEAAIIDQLLINRKIKKEDWPSFLNPRYEELFDPFLLKGMKEAVDLVQRAAKDKKIIGLFGDYDADGVPGTALLYEYLRRLGLEVAVYIPSREKGYGLNRDGIDELKSRGAEILLTIDLGVRNALEIEYAKKQGLSVIVIDHHEVGALPKCIVIDPKQKGDHYPFKELAATGLVFKFITALNQKLMKLPPSQLKWMLDLVGISTICDMVPLVSENRILAKYGLIVLKKTKRLGLVALCQEAGIPSEKIDTYAVGFQIGPRLNAPGRMSEAKKSFELLTSEDPLEAKKLAQELNAINLKRQAELDRVLKEAQAKVKKDRLDHKKVIFVHHRHWPDGVVGLVAGRLMEEYARPVIVCDHQQEQLKGSCRSIEGYNLVEALDQAKEYLLKYGGHKKAAGLTLEYRHLSNLYDKLLEVAESKLKDEDLQPKITIDRKLDEKDLSLNLYRQITELAPFGLGNSRPVFLLEKAAVSDLRTVGKDNRHLKFKAAGIAAIGFDLGERKDELKEGRADLVFTLDEDSWGGSSKLQLKVLDMKVG